MRETAGVLAVFIVGRKDMEMNRTFQKSLATFFLLDVVAQALYLLHKKPVKFGCSQSPEQSGIMREKCETVSQNATWL